MGHYYARDGSPQHFCGPNRSATTLREARKFGLLPSVTEILNLIAKPQLEKWKRDQAVMAALTLPKLPDEGSESFLKRIDADGSRQAQEAASVGTAIHAALEAGFASQPVPLAYRPHWQATQRMLADNFGQITDWVSEKRFAHPDGYGGACDLHSPSTGIVIDFKSSDIRSGSVKKLAWDQNIQLGAYQHGLGLKRAPCANLFLSRVEPGYIVQHDWSEDEIEHGLSIFQAALTLWKRVKKFNGGCS